MKTDQIAAILYTVREFVQTEDGLKESLEKLANIGYRAVQASGIGPDGPGPEAVRKACDAFGMTICATHENAGLVLSAPDQIADRLDTFGTDVTAYAYPQGVDLRDAAQLGPWLESLEQSTIALKARGKTLCYHNHDIEFVRHGGKTVYERIFAETSIAAEMDTYWVQAGGASPLEWTERLASAGRLPVMHLKDYTVVGGRTPNFAPIGSGNINFAPIIEAAEKGGCRYFIVEQDNCYGRDPFDCLADSFRYLRDVIAE